MILYKSQLNVLLIQTIFHEVILFYNCVSSCYTLFYSYFFYPCYWTLNLYWWHATNDIKFDGFDIMRSNIKTAINI